MHQARVDMVIMASFDDVVVSRDSDVVKELFKVIHLEHIDLLPSDDPVQLLGKVIKQHQNSQNNVSSKIQAWIILSTYGR